MKRCVMIGLVCGLPGLAEASCASGTAPIADLSFDSRYVEGDTSRSVIDPERAAAAEAALGPLDAFIADLATATDVALETQDSAAALCIVDALVHWAKADALSNLATPTVELTIGSRLAAIALLAQQVSPYGSDEQTAILNAWLLRRLYEQMSFWETAPEGARRGNLRAWAGLAGAAVAQLTQDPVVRGWAAWSVIYVACSANADGSLPQEMKRGPRALHYQLHAVAPLTVGAALLSDQGISLTGQCDRALHRIVEFTLTDLDQNGAKSAEHAGKAQTLEGGFEDLKDFQLAWAEAWLTLNPLPNLQEKLQERRPLRYSKLGGDQSRIWGPARN